MKLVNYKIHASKQDVIESLYNSSLIIEREKFEQAKGTPKFHIKERNGIFRIKCEYTGGATKDNGFLEGTYFLGKISQNSDQTSLTGLIVTAPIYHIILGLLFVFFVAQCIIKKGFTPVPLILFCFSLFMFKDEFKKQAIIKRYIFRAFKNTFEKLNSSHK